MTYHTGANMPWHTSRVLTGVLRPFPVVHDMSQYEIKWVGDVKLMQN